MRHTVKPELFHQSFVLLPIFPQHYQPPRNKDGAAPQHVVLVDMVKTTTAFLIL